MVEVLHDAVARAAEEREVAHHFVLDRGATDGAFGAELVVITGGEPNARLERIGRLTSDDVDRAADRVTPIERALRTPQDLDALDVQESMSTITGRPR